MSAFHHAINRLCWRSKLDALRQSDIQRVTRALASLRGYVERLLARCAVTATATVEVTSGHRSLNRICVPSRLHDVLFAVSITSDAVSAATERQARMSRCSLLVLASCIAALRMPTLLCRSSCKVRGMAIDHRGPDRQCHFQPPQRRASQRRLRLELPTRQLAPLMAILRSPQPAWAYAINAAFACSMVRSVAALVTVPSPGARRVSVRPWQYGHACGCC